MYFPTRQFWIFLVFFAGLLSSSYSKGKGKRPRNVHADVINITGLRLTWQPPRGEKLCPVRHYLVRLKPEGAKKSKRWRLDGARQSLSLHGLAEDTLYYIRVMGVACDGKTRPSKWVKVRTMTADQPGDAASSHDNYTETQTPAKPTYVRTRTFPDSVILSWLPPEDDTVVRGYMVGYGEGVPDVNWQYVDASRRNVTIRNLKPGTQYVISLRAFNNFGKGPVVYDLIYTREKSGDISGTPLGTAKAPQELRAKVLSPTTTWLQWIDPSLGRHQQITDNRYYNVHYQNLPQGKTRSVIVKALNVVLYELTPGTTYLFRVRTIKDARASPFSNSVRNRTFEAAPGSAPRSLTITPTNASTDVHLTWRPPKHPNGDITGYLVFYTTNPELPNRDWIVFGVLGKDSDTVISHLDSNTTYYYRVQARNSQGYGPMTETVIYKTPTEDQTRQAATVADYEDEELDVEEDFEEEEDEDVAILPDKDSYNKEDMDDPFFEHEYNLDKGNSTTYKDGDNNMMIATNATESGVDVEENQNRHNKRHDHYVAPPQTMAQKQEKWAPRFSSEVQQTVTAAVSWVSPCVSEMYASVTYLFQYYEKDYPEDYSTLTLDRPFVLLDNLKNNKRYHYKVKMIVADRDSEWSEEQLLDTS